MFGPIVRWSLRFRFLLLGLVVSAAHPRRAPGAEGADRRAARVQPTLCRGPDRGPRPVGGGGRATHHRPARGRSPPRRRLARRDQLRIDRRPVVHRADLRARHGRHPGSADGRRAADAGARAAERLEAAGHAPAALVDEPRDDGRVYRPTRSRSSTCRCSPAGSFDRASSARRASPTSRSGASGTASSRSSSIRGGCARSESGSSRSSRPSATPCGPRR